MPSDYRSAAIVLLFNPRAQIYFVMLVDVLSPPFPIYVLRSECHTQHVRAENGRIIEQP